MIKPVTGNASTLSPDASHETSRTIIPAPIAGLDAWLHRLANRLVDCDLHPREVAAIIGTADLTSLVSEFGASAAVKWRVRWLVELLDFACICFGQKGACTWLREPGGPGMLPVIEALIAIPESLPRLRGVLEEQCREGGYIQ